MKQEINGFVIPSMKSGGPSIATGNVEVDYPIIRSTGKSGDALVTIPTANGYETVLAGSVFDPTSVNFKK